MPTDTFFNLTEEKKEKILKACINEFSKVPFEEASIKNIVEDAGIPRGSFYQYFIDKKDVFDYLIDRNLEKIIKFLNEDVENNKGKDVFEIYIDLFDYVINDLLVTDDINSEFHKMVLKNAKFSDNNMEFMPPPPPPKISDSKRPFRRDDFLEKINISNLKITDKEDLNLLTSLLAGTTMKFLFKAINEEDNKLVRENYIKTLNIIKYGVIN